MLQPLMLSDPQCCRFRRSQTQFALQAIVERRAAVAKRIAVLLPHVLSQRAGCHGSRVCPAYPAVICPLSEGDAVSGLWMLTEAGGFID